MKISNVLISSLLFTAVSFAQEVETPAQPERPELTKEQVKENIKNRHAKVRQEMEGMTKEERQEFKAGLKEQAKARRAERKAKVQAKLENMTEAERAEFKEKRQARKEIRKEVRKELKGERKENRKERRKDKRQARKEVVKQKLGAISEEDRTAIKNQIKESIPQEKKEYLKKKFSEKPAK